MDDLDKFEEARISLEKFLESHQGSTRTEIIQGMGWSPEKVDLMLEYLVSIGVATPTEDPDGETHYTWEFLFTVLGRKAKEAQERARFGDPAPPEPSAPPKDYVQLLKEKGLL